VLFLVERFTTTIAATRITDLLGIITTPTPPIAPTV
jgi:hypothetical protein